MDVKRPWIWAVIVVALILVTVVLLVRRQRPYDQVALSMADAMLDGDTDRVLPYLFREEIELVGYDREKVAAVYEEVVRPSLGGVKIIGTERDLNESYGYGSRILRLPSGRRFFVRSIVYATEDGPRTLFSDEILESFLREYDGSTASLLATRKAMLAGLRKHRQALESAGVHGIVEFDTSNKRIGVDFKMRTWKELEDSLVTKINAEMAGKDRHQVSQ